MSDKKITQLTQVNSLTGAELLPLAQGGVTKSASVDQLRGYKVYTALLTQSGGQNTDLLEFGNLIIGVTYRIQQNFGDSDWTNVGAPNNNIDTWFVATGTTPNSWGSGGGLFFDLGAPVATVLENTIGNIWWTYENTGYYKANSASLFTINKTIVYSSIDQFQTTTADYSATGTISNSIIGYQTFLGGSVTNDSVGFIEIRVYN